MKPNFKLRSFLVGSALFAMIGASHGQVQYYYDNVAGAGFGNAANTWGTNNVISTDPTGTAAAANPTTTTADTLNLGTSTLGLGAGTVTVVAGGRSIGSIVRGSASSAGIINVSGGTITFAGNGIVNNIAGPTLSINSVIAGGVTSMTFTDTTVTGANTYLGRTIIAAGALHRIGSIGNASAASTLGASNSNASNLVFEDGALLRIDSTTNQSTNRNFTINGASAEIYVRDNGDVTWNGTASYGTLNQAATLRLNSANAVTGDGIFAGVLADNGTGQLSLNKVGTSTATESAWTLSNANTFTGSTTITGGILVLGNANALQNSYINTTASITGSAVAGLRTTGAALNLGGLSGDKDLSAIYTSSTGGYGSVTGITLNVASANNLSYSGVIDGGRSLTKSGAGTQVLTGINLYTGATTVSAGVLAVNGSLANTTTTITGGTLQGSGTIGGSVTIQSGGTLAPGNSIESLGTGALSFATASTYAFELQTNLYAGTPNVSADLTYSSGTLDIATGAFLTLTDLATSTALANDSKLTLISYFGGWTGAELFTYNAATLNDGATFTLGANQWRFDYNDASGGPNYTANQTGATSFVTMTVVPEPRAALLGSLGLLVLLRRRRH